MRFKLVDDYVAELRTVTEGELAERAKDLKPPAPGLEYAGTLTMEFRRFKVLKHRLANERRKLSRELNAMVSKSPRLTKLTEEMKTLAFKVEALDEKLAGLSGFLSAAIRAEFGLVNAGRIQTCKNWELYLLDPVCKDCGRRHDPEEETGGGVRVLAIGPNDLAELFGSVLGPVSPKFRDN